MYQWNVLADILNMLLLLLLLSLTFPFFKPLLVIISKLFLILSSFNLILFEDVSAPAAHDQFLDRKSEDQTQIDH